MPVQLYRALDVRSKGFAMEAELTGKLLRNDVRPYEVPDISVTLGPTKSVTARVSVVGEPPAFQTTTTAI
jgi:hypothetical protein